MIIIMFMIIAQSTITENNNLQIEDAMLMHDKQTNRHRYISIAVLFKL